MIEIRNPKQEETPILVEYFKTMLIGGPTGFKPYN